MKRPGDLRGVVALVLALGVTIPLTAFSVLAAVKGRRVLSSEELGALTTVLGASIGAVAVYLGNGLNGGHMTETRPPQRPAEPPQTEEYDVELELEQDADEITQGMGPDPDADDDA